jgi:nucleoside-diphosphate-sugar epimerase
MGLSTEILDTFSGKNILVSGGAGFVGGNLVRALLDAKPARITIVDNLLSAERSNVPSRPEVRFIEGSIADDRVLAQIADEEAYVFHLATYHGNQSSIADPIADHDNNTLTTLKLFEHLGRFQRTQRVVYSSAGCTVAEKTYDEAAATTEEGPVSLWHDSPYQISKLIGEFYANFYFMRHKLPVVKARFQNVYGPREILGAGKWRGTPATVWRNVVPTFAYRALKKMPLQLENGGIATRDFIYVDDIVRGLILCAVRGKPGEVYNLASGVETSIRDLAEAIVRLAETQTPIEIAPARDWDRSGRRFGSTKKSSSELGFGAEVDLQRGLQETLAWMRAEMPMIDACIARHKHRLPELA